MKVKTIFSSLCLSVMLILAACGNGDGNKNATEVPSSGGSTIQIDDSSTVFPIMEAITLEFVANEVDVKAPIGVSGSGDGFEKFALGETDINNASHPIKDEETQKTEEEQY